MNLKHLQLVEEHPTHFLLHNTKTNQSLTIAKPHVSEEFFKTIRKLPKVESEQKLAKGGKVSSDPKKQPGYQDGMSNEEINRTNAHNQGPVIGAYADGGEVGDVGNQVEEAQAGEMPEAEASATIPEVPEQVPPINPSETTPFQESQKQDSSSTLNPFTSNSTGLGSPMDLTKQSFDLRQGANTAIGEAQSAQQKQIGQVAGDLSDRLSELQNDWQTKRDDLTTKANQYTQDIANFKFQPYWSNQSTSNKINAGIGLLLGGLAQGSLINAGDKSAQNPALVAINKAIDMDLDQQKLELGKKESLLSSIYKQTGNLDSSVNTAKLFSLSQAQAQLQQAAANSNSQIVKQNAIAANGALDAQKAQIANQQALYQTTQGIVNGRNGQGNGTADPVQQNINFLRSTGNEKVAEQAEKEYELHQTKQTALETAQEIQNEVGKMQTVGNRLTNPIQSGAQINALNARLYPLVQALNPSKRLTEFSAKAEIEPYQINLRDNPETAQKKTQALINYIKTQSAPTPLIDQWVSNKKPNYFPQITTPIK